MQVLKKISLALCCLIIASCGTTNVRDEGGVDSVNTDIAEIGISGSDSFRVGMLLPLTGTDAKYGTGLKNASMLALQDVNKPIGVAEYQYLLPKNKLQELVTNEIKKSKD